jgi:hypothetical protein
VLLAEMGFPENQRSRCSRILRGTPAGVLTLHVQDIVFHLEGKLVGVAIRTRASIGQSLHPTFLLGAVARRSVIR